MTIWYDVSDLMTWRLPHLTGIPRTTIGILGGLLTEGVPVRLTRFDRRRGFEPLDLSQLPAAVRRHLPGVASEPAAPISSAEPQRRRQRRSRILGRSQAATEFRTACRAFGGSVENLGQTFSRWLAVRIREAAPRLPSPTFAGRTRPLPVRPVVPDGPFAAGDVLLSLGASWPIEGHAPAVAAIRLRGVCVLRMVYDLIPTIKPQWVDEPTVRQVSAWVRNVLTASDRVLTISEFSRSEIERYCQESSLPLPPTSVVRLGDDLGSSCDATPPLPRFVPRRPFFVCVSTLDVRKNHRLLYDAWQVLAARDPEHCPDLVCLGVPHVLVGDLMHEIRHDRAVNGRIHVLHGIEDAELAWYYRHCTATIYPSRYEGWGLPVAESLAHGRLCLASNATSIPEISPDLPEFFHPLDALGLVALVERTLRDPDWVRTKETEIRARFTPTPWTHTARQVRTAITATRGGAVTRDAA